MKIKHIQQSVVAILLLITLGFTSCRTTTTPAVNRNMAPQRVDIRGSIVSSRYSEGQVVLEVENFMPSTDSRYDRAYVLVMPTAQMFGQDGKSIVVSELSQGQNVAILLRGGGRGNRVGVGVARKLWIEDRF